MEPITRKEKFLAAAGGQSVDLPEPITREETFLKAIAEGGGGGGSDLPDVTVADNGKVLGVVNGEWDKTDATLVCTFTKSGNTISCDKTRTEILEAYDAGKTIYGKADLYSMFSTQLLGIGIFKLENIDETNNRHVKFVCNAIVPYSSEQGEVTLATPSILYLYGTTVLSYYYWQTETVPLPPVPTVNQAGRVYMVGNNGIAGWGSSAQVIIPDTDSANSLLATFSSFMNTALATPGELVYVRQTGTTFNGLDDIVDLLNRGTLGYIYFALGSANQACMITSFDSSPAEIGIHITLYDVVVQPNIRVYASTDTLIKSSEIRVVGTAQLMS